MFIQVPPLIHILRDVPTSQHVDVICHTTCTSKIDPILEPLIYVLLEASNVFVREVMFLTNYLYRSRVFWDTLQPLQFPVLFEREPRETANPRKEERVSVGVRGLVRPSLCGVCVSQYVCRSLSGCVVSHTYTYILYTFFLGHFVLLFLSDE